MSYCPLTSSYTNWPKDGVKKEYRDTILCFPPKFMFPFFQRTFIWPGDSLPLHLLYFQMYCLCPEYFTAWAFETQQHSTDFVDFHILLCPPFVEKVSIEQTISCLNKGSIMEQCKEWGGNYHFKMDQLCTSSYSFVN